MMGHDNLATLRPESLKSGHGGIGIETIHFRLDEPTDRSRDRGLAALPPPRDFGGVKGSITNHAVEPGESVLRRPPLKYQLDKRLLDDILGRVAPLACV